MTALRIIPLPIHSALEMLIGLALGAAPFALGLSTAAAFVGVVAGVLMVGLSLQSLDTGTGDGIRLGAHLAADQGAALGLATAAAILASAGDPLAATLFAAAAIGHLALILATRYSAR
ncbi:MAG TPA: hypothetical protein VGW75_12990 [Solirubrobacteraceae bacterium]|jgi:hypothetical protein|nr:hypothetical protein [Solirubrobacteraceae bacterium]